MTMRVSALPMFWACPSSALDCEHPYSPESDAAALGTAVHKALQMMINEASPDPSLSVIAVEHDVDLEELSRLYDIGRDAWTNLRLHAGLDAEVHSELRLEGEAFSGTADIVLVGQDEIVVIDWKSGRLRGDAETQVMGYLDLARKRFGPRPSYRGIVMWLQFGDIEAHDYEDENLDAFEETYARKLENIGKAYAPGVACRYCRRQLECSARREFMQATALAIAEPTCKKLFTPDLLAALYDRAKMLEKCLDQFKDAVSLHVQENGGLDLPNGKRIVERHYQREQYDPRTTWQVLTQQHGFTQEDMAQVLSVGTTAIKRIIGAKTDKGQKVEKQAQALQDIRDANGARTISYSKLIQVKGSNS